MNTAPDAHEAGETKAPRLALARRFGALLASPCARFLVPLAGALLTLPSLVNGLAFEDAALRWRARGSMGEPFWTRFDLFSFWPGDPARRAHLTDAGFFPWFASPDLRIEFFRPLSAALHVVDFTLLDRWPWLMHLESIALYALLIALAAAIYRRLLPLPLAMLAALLYALDPGHGIPVGWLSNRNAVVATTLGLAALLAHDRRRRDGWRTGAWLGPMAFAMALLGGESGLGALAFLVAHALMLDRAPKTERALALLPYGIIAVAWQLVYRRLGYGTQGTGFYLDPMSNPAAYLSALPGRVLALLLGQLALPPASLYNILPFVGKLALVVVAILFLGYLARALGPLLRTSAPTRFFALGMVLSLAPVVATFPDNRLLLFAGFGAFGIVAPVIGDLRALAPPDSPRALRRLWIALHLVLAPLLLPITSLAMPLLARTFAPPAADAKVPGQTVVLLNPPMAVYGMLPWMYPSDPARPVPRQVQVLTGAVGRVDIMREDARTLVVDWAPDAAIDPVAPVFRDEAHPLHEGERFTVPGLRAEVLHLDAHAAPRSVRYSFDRDLDDPSFRWIAWAGAFTEVMPPAIGARATFGAN